MMTNQEVAKTVKENIKLVHWVANKYKNRGLAHEDLVQEGAIGLMTAAQKFDPERGVKFSTYAVWWIRQGINRALAEQGHTIRIPEHTLAEISVLVKAARALTHQLKREPTHDEIAQKLGAPVEQVRKLLKTVKDPVSLDVPIGDDDGAHLGDTVADNATPSAAAILDAKAEIDSLCAVFKALTPREEKVLRLRFGVPAQARVTSDDGVRERIMAIEAKALAKLKPNKRG